MKRLLNTTKSALFLLLLLAVAGVAKAQQWEELHRGVTEDLYDVCCIDTSNVLACGSNGMIVKTTDGGQTWEQKNSNSGASLFLLKFANENVGFACGDETLLKTTDGGESWIIVETNPEMGFHYGYSYLSQPNLFLVDADTLYVTDSYNNLWKSIDCGESFEKALDLQGTLEDFYKFDLYFEDNVGYLVGYSDWIWLFSSSLTFFKTLDYGKTWEAIEFTECGSMLSAAHFMDKDHIRLYGYFETTPDEYYGVLETTDGMGGYSLLMPVESGAGFPDPWGRGEFMAFSSENVGCLVYSLTTVKEQSDIQSFALLTQDNGETWISTTDGINCGNYLYAVDCADTMFYIAASNGYVYKAGFADVINGLEEMENPIKIYPNPSAETIFVSLAADFNAGDLDLFGIDLSTLSGQIIIQKDFRGNSTMVDITNLPSGIYLLCVKSEKQRFVKRIVKQ